MRSRRNRGGGNRKITDVRMVPEGEDQRGMKIERMISAVKSSQSQVRVLIHARVDQPVSGTAVVNTFTFANIREQADFTTVADEYSNYKVAGIRFEIFDLNPSVYAAGTFGTFHVQGPGEYPSVSSQILDLADATQVPPGTGKVVLYWFPSGPIENGWYSTVQDEADFGGLADYLSGGPGSSTPKFSILVTAVVDFRARK